MKRISTLAIAALLAVSISAFADNKPAEGKSCDKASAAECQKKDPNCTKKCTSDNHSCPTHANNSCKKATDKK